MKISIYIKNLIGISHINIFLLLIVLLVNSCNKRNNDYDTIFVDTIAEISENGKNVDFYQKHSPPPLLGQKSIKNEYAYFYIDNIVGYDNYYSKNIKQILLENNFDVKSDLNNLPYTKYRIKSKFLSKNKKIVILQMKTNKTINFSFINFKQKGNTACFILNEEYKNSSVKTFIIVEKFNDSWRIKNQFLVGRG